MSQNKLAKLRNSDVFKALMRVLAEYRIPKQDFDVLDKRPHPLLTIRYCGVERSMSMPSTPKTKGKAPVAYSSELRRLLKEMQMAALSAPAEDEIMSQQSNFAFDGDRMPIVSVRDGHTFTDSRHVAEYFGKRHGDVLRDIRNLHCSEGFRNRHFATFKNKDLTGEHISHVEMTKDGFAFLAMGFTGKEVASFKERYIEQFNAMSEELQRREAHAVNLNDPAWLRGQLLSYTEKVMELQTTVAQQTPKVEALERIAEADGSLCITDAAKNLQINPRQLFRYLDTNAWTYTRPGTATRLAYQSRITAGYLEHKVTTKVKEDGSDLVFTQVRITPKGLTHLAQILSPATKVSK